MCRAGDFLAISIMNELNLKNWSKSRILTGLRNFESRTSAYCFAIYPSSELG
jgi:hypothetical protein